MFVHSCITVFAALPMSFTYCAYWSAFISLSKCSLMKVENADRAQLKPCARQPLQSINKLFPRSLRKQR